MTKLDSAVLVIGAGNYFTAPYTEATPAVMPANPLEVTSPYINVGHTSLDEIFSLTSEGGEATTIGTLQNRSLRTVYADRSEAINFTLQQFDKASLKLYFGSNATEDAETKTIRPAAGRRVPTIVTFLAVFVDGSNYFAIHAPKAEVIGREDITIGDVDSIAGLPLTVRPLRHGSNEWAYQITPLGTV